MRPGDVVEVKDGYGRNYLVPRGVAIRWTRAPRSGRRRSSRPASRARSATSTTPSEIKAKLEALTVTVKVRAGAGGRLFGAVTAADDRRRGRPRPPAEQVDKRTIEIGNPIKTLGAHQVTVRLHDDVSATVTLNVVAGLSSTQLRSERARLPPVRAGPSWSLVRRCTRTAGRRGAPSRRRPSQRRRARQRSRRAGAHEARRRTPPRATQTRGAAPARRRPRSTDRRVDARA